MKRVYLIGAAVLACALLAWLWSSSRGEGGGPAGSPDLAAGRYGKAAVGATTPARAAEDERMRLRARSPGSIAGRVSDPSGAAAAGARVCAVAHGSQLTADDRQHPNCVVADGAGAYRFEDQRPASYSISASAVGFAPGRYRDEDGERSFRLRPGENKTGVDVTLESGGVEVKGVVLDLSGGTVAGAWVTLQRRAGWRERGGTAAVESDEKGQFSAWVGAGEISVQAVADGYASGSARATAPGQHVEVVLTPESVLAGRVVEVGTGKPVAGARVAVSERSWRSRGGSDSGSTLTGEDGSFRLTRLSPGRYKPEAEALGRTGVARESVLLGLGQTVDNVLIEVHPAVMVAGRITIDDQGTPCRDGGARLHDKERDETSYESIEAEDGRVAFPAVLPGTYTVTVGCDGYLERDEYPEIVVADADVIDLVWQVDQGATVTGMVKTAGGEAVAGASVWARTVGGDPRGQRSWEADETDLAGAFELDGLVAGEYALEVQHADYPSPADSVKVSVESGGRSTVDVVLDDGGTLRGLVVDERGVAVTGAMVRAIGKRWGWGGMESVNVRDDGTFELDGLRAGEYRVVATRGGGWWGGDSMRAPGATDDDTHGEKVSVVAGEVAEVRIVVESQDGRISGRVVDETGQAVVDAYVDAERESTAAGRARGASARSVRWGQWRRKPILTDMDGRFEVGDLSPGSYTLRAYRKGGGDVVAEGVELGADVTLTIRSPGSLAGTVVIAGAGAPEQFTITVEEPMGGFDRSEEFFRTKGQWAMRDLPAGDYRISVEAPEGTDRRDKVALAEGEDKAGIELVLEARAEVSGQFVDLATKQPVAGLEIMVESIKGGGSTTFMLGNEDKEKITGADGRFHVERAPAGRVYVTAFPIDWTESPYGFSRIVASLPAGEKTDLGQLVIPRRRLEVRDRAGDLGFVLKELEPDVEPEAIRLEVALVHPDGPAVGSGLQVGDVIATVEGHDCIGANHYLYWALSRVPAGETVSLGLERGATVEIKAGKPR